MKTLDHLKDINLNHWSISQKSTQIGKESFITEIGWSNLQIDSHLSPSKHWEAIPQLVYTIARLGPEYSSWNNLSKAPKIWQNRFLKFYHPELKQIILKAEIRVRWKTSPTFNTKELYKFLFSEFWVDNKIFNKSESCDGTEYSPFLINWEGIFVGIWVNYCQLENRPIISHGDFVDYLSALTELARDTVVAPLNKMNNKDYKARLPWISTNTHPEDCKYLGMSPDRWAKGTPLSKNAVFAGRVEDARDYLNTFFLKHSRATVKNALELFLVEMFESFAEALKRKHLITKCAHCGDYFTFLKKKKYCSMLKEGKDCGKQARNRKYYRTTGQKRLPKYRESTNDLRAFYKEKGIKK